MLTEYGRQRHRGLSLVELMIVLFLLGVLFAGLFHLYLNAKRQYDWLEANYAITRQQNLLSELLRQSLRGAAYNACGHWHSMLPFDHQLQRWLESPIQILHRDAKKLAPVVSHRMLTNSVALRVMQLSHEHSQLSQAMTSNDHLLLDSCAGVRPKSLLMVTDCSTAEVSLVKVVTTSMATGLCSVTLMTHLNHRYDKGSVAGVFFDHTLYVAKVKRSASKNSTRALYIKPRNSNSEEVSDHVEAMEARLESQSLPKATDKWQLPGVLSNKKMMTVRLQLSASGVQGREQLFKSWLMAIKLRNVAR